MISRFFGAYKRTHYFEFQNYYVHMFELNTYYVWLAIHRFTFELGTVSFSACVYSETLLATSSTKPSLGLIIVGILRAKCSFKGGGSASGPRSLDHITSALLAWPHTVCRLHCRDCLHLPRSSLPYNPLMEMHTCLLWVPFSLYRHNMSVNLCILDYFCAGIIKSVLRCNVTVEPSILPVWWVSRPVSTEATGGGTRGGLLNLERDASEDTPSSGGGRSLQCLVFFVTADCAWIQLSFLAWLVSHCSISTHLFLVIAAAMLQE